MKKKQLLAKAFYSTVLVAGMLFSSSSVFAQVKIGTNPTTINSANNLEVEASTAGRKTSIDKTTGQVTIADGTQGAGKQLTSDANGGASWVSPGAQDSPVLFYVNSSSNQTSVAGANDVANFSAKVYDKGNNFDLTADQLTIPANGTGIYQFNCIYGTLNQSILQGVYLQIQVNGTTNYLIAIGNCAPNAGIGGAGSIIVPLNGGDLVKLKLIPSLLAGQSMTFFHIALSGSMVSK